MIDLLSVPARRCSIATAALVHNHRILLVKHKKLNIWLCPGGHVEGTELPHQTAERECFEETGVKVEAISPFPLIESDEEQFVPVPVLSGIHWISKENYETRIHSPHPDQPHRTKLWPRGCEQHIGGEYLVKPVGSLDFHHDPHESTAIGWFGLADLASLETTETIKQELRFILASF